MDVKNFFSQIDDTTRSKETMQKAKEAESRVFTETTLNFAHKLMEVVECYIPEFEKRGYRCENRTGNLPYWSFVVSNTSGARVEVAIVSGYKNDYEIAFYHQDERINASLNISRTFDKLKVETELQHLFKKLV